MYPCCLPAPIDFVKFQLPYGWSVSVLAWSALEFPAAFSGANAQLYGVAKRNLLWAADFIVKSHVTASDNPADNVYVAQVGKLSSSVAFWTSSVACVEEAVKLVLASGGGRVCKCLPCGIATKKASPPEQHVCRLFM